MKLRILVILMYGVIYLAKITGTEAFAEAGLDPVNISKCALIGRKFNVIKLFIEYGFPNRKGEVGPLFLDDHMTIKAAQFFMSSIPDFITSQGPEALYNAACSDRIDLCKALLDAGIKGNQNALAAAFQNHNIELIELLIKNGADPYSPAINSSLIHQALRMKSSDLLKALDIEARYSAEIAQVEKEFRPKGTSALLGTWKYSPSGGGFGTVVLRFHPDGTVQYGGDIGGVSGIWRETEESAEIFVPDMKGDVDPEPVMRLIRTSEGLRLVDPSGEDSESKSKVLRKLATEDMESQKRYPLLVRLEKMYLTAEGNLLIQVSRRHIVLPLSRLVEVAREAKHVKDSVEGSLLRWEDFIDEPIRDPGPTAIEIPFEDRYASPDFARKRDTLCFDHNLLATLNEGRAYTVFPSTTTERYHGPDSGPYGEALLGYAILSKEPFSHGKDWLLFFFKRSKKDI